MNNNYRRNYYITPSQIRGNGVFAKRFLQKYRVIGIVIYDYLYIYPTLTYKSGNWINQSFNPNSQLHKRGEYYYLVVSRDILPNQEITTDYNNFPWFVSRPGDYYK